MENQTPSGNNPQSHSFFNKAKRVFVLFWIMVLIASVSFVLTKAGIFSGPLASVLFTWPAIFVFIAIFLLCIRQWSGALLVGFIGVFFWLHFLRIGFPDTLSYLPVQVDMSYFAPLLFGVIAVIMIIQVVFPSAKKRAFLSFVNHGKSAFHNNTTNSTSEYFENNTSFGSSEQILFTKQFKGGNAKVAFGDLHLDLRNVMIEPGTTPDIFLEINMAACNIIVPPHWFIEVKATAFMGEINVRHNPNLTDDTPIVYISGSCNMASIIIK